MLGAEKVQAARCEQNQVRIGERPKGGNTGGATIIQKPNSFVGITTTIRNMVEETVHLLN